MWICLRNDWDSSHTDLSKYLVEKVKQQVDEAEVISNRHKTTNGFVLMQELALMISLVQEKSKFKRRLENLISESQSSFISTSVVNDYIMSKHFPDICDAVKKINFSLLDAQGLHRLLLSLEIYNARLEKNYLNAIEEELKLIDFSSSRFVRYANTIDSLIDCLIPYLLFMGYSITSISDITFRSIKRARGRDSFVRLLNGFRGQPREFKFLFVTKKSSSEFSFIKTKLNKKKVQIKIVKLGQIREYLADQSFSLPTKTELVEITTSVLDPHDFLRSLYDEGIKLYVASKDRLSLNYFTNFFDNVYWRLSKSKQIYDKSRINIDPVNVSARVSTLRLTLSKLSVNRVFKYESELPVASELREAVYFYNLALGSKSIENSLALLWTSLETLIPYRTFESDIDNVKTFVSKTLCIGAVSRQLFSFILRFTYTSNQNNPSLLGFKAKEVKYTTKALVEWARWLTINYQGDIANDPFDKIKAQSNLLARQFSNLNNLYNGTSKETIDTLTKRILHSKASISHQLDRIYLHRNRIVHAGELINEYSNLWSHLEWYIGKLLAFAMMNAGARSIHDNFIRLEADYEQLMSLLTKRTGKKISEATEIFPRLFEHVWQAF